MAESLSINNVTRQIAREDILNNKRQGSFKSNIPHGCYVVCITD